MRAVIQLKKDSYYIIPYISLQMEISIFHQHLKIEMTSYPTSQNQSWNRNYYPQGFKFDAQPAHYTTSVQSGGALPAFKPYPGNLHDNSVKIQEAEVTRTATTTTKWYDPPKIEMVSGAKPQYSPTQNAKESAKNSHKNDEAQPKPISKCKKAGLLLLGLLLFGGIIAGTWLAIRARNRSRALAQNSGCPETYIQFEGQCLTCPAQSKWYNNKCIKDNGQSVASIYFSQQIDLPITVDQKGVAACSNGFTAYQGKCVKCPQTSSWNGTNCLKFSGNDPQIAQLETIVEQYLRGGDQKIGSPVNSTQPKITVPTAPSASSNSQTSTQNTKLIATTLSLNTTLATVSPLESLVQNVDKTPPKSHNSMIRRHLSRGN